MLEEFEEILREAYKSVEDVFSAEDKGWINLSISSQAGINVLSADQRKQAVQKARYYHAIDPLAHRAVALMTDYSFGTGLTWNSEEDTTIEAMSNFWDAQVNQAILSPLGQRKSSDKLLVDGEIFFAVFLGSKGQATIRRIDPLEITEIITDIDDLEDVRYYKRMWTDTQGKSNEAYYRSFANIKDKSVKDWQGKNIKSNEDALVYHLAINTLGQRGNSYLLPALDWIKLTRQSLASHAAITLALAKFAWKTKTLGGQTAVDSMKAKVDGSKPDAGSWLIENMGSDTQPIRVDTGANQAYQDVRILKLQVSAATGWPEQYFGDISIGNLATAKTVELPVMKMCQSYESIWRGCYEAIDNLILEHAGIPENKRYIDRDFPDITPQDALTMAQSLQALTMAFPQLVDSEDVLQRALIAIGINDTQEVIDALNEAEKKNPNVALAKALRQFREVISNGKVSHV